MSPRVCLSDSRFSSNVFNFPLLYVDFTFYVTVSSPVSCYAKAQQSEEMQ
jgi:hypothetical protein